MKNIKRNLILAAMGVAAIVAIGLSAEVGSGTAATDTASAAVVADREPAKENTPVPGHRNTSAPAPTKVYSTSRSELIKITDRTVDLTVMGLVMANTGTAIPDALLDAQRANTAEITDLKNTTDPDDSDVSEAAADVLDAAQEILADNRVTDSELETDLVIAVTGYGLVTGWEMDEDALTTEAMQFVIEG